MLGFLFLFIGLNLKISFVNNSWRISGFPSSVLGVHHHSPSPHDFLVASEMTPYLGDSRKLLCSGYMMMAIFREHRASLCSLWLRNQRRCTFMCIIFGVELAFQTDGVFLLCLINNGAESSVCLLVTNSTNGCGEKLSVCGLCSLCYCLMHFLPRLRGSYFLRQGQFRPR